MCPSSNPMQGITMFRRSLAEEPYQWGWTVHMGILSMQSGQYKRATEADFGGIDQYHPNNLRDSFLLGRKLIFEANQKK